MNKTLFVVAISMFLLNGCTTFYRVLRVSPSDKTGTITFTTAPSDPLYEFYYSDTLNNVYLRELRQGYKLDVLTAVHKDELGKILAILDWGNRQWEHSGSNNPSKPDALTILKEAGEGNSFRCVEYGIVAAAALTSVGIPARVLGLKTRDVEKVRRGAGHVVAEVYASSLEKWIFIDPQFNVLPTLNGIPLNAVEFQNAIINNRSQLVLVNAAGEVPAENTEAYLSWVAKYLFYFDALFDQRIEVAPDYKEIGGMTKITLVPVGEKEPRVFQRTSRINYSWYTNSLNDFYRKPE
ncbi:MAG: transglutaminase-like domain-containing protein [Bacteroidota bacterium]